MHRDDTSFNDKDTSPAGVHKDNTSFTGVPILNTNVVTYADNKSEEEPDHDSVDPIEAYDTSSKASVHSTGSHISIHSITSEPPQHPPDEENDMELPELETPVPILH